ncbi:hypothetical protein ACFRKB_09110 [Streptomyces scopuliridis]|uniref:hypothetical protein n=1 Tax=Streptomyces scopuliridis TaxID=452529 RepID=UPI0036790418
MVAMMTFSNSVPELLSVVLGLMRVQATPESEPLAEELSLSPLSAEGVAELLAADQQGCRGVEIDSHIGSDRFPCRSEGLCQVLTGGRAGRGGPAWR